MATNRKKTAPFSINPLASDDFMPLKSPEDMTKEELLLYLEIKKLNVKLNFEKLQSSISYTGMILDAIQNSGLKEWVLDLIDQKAFRKPE